MVGIRIGVCGRFHTGIGKVGSTISGSGSAGSSEFDGSIPESDSGRGINAGFGSDRFGKFCDISVCRSGGYEGTDDKLEESVDRSNELSSVGSWSESGGSVLFDGIDSGSDSAKLEGWV